MPVHDRMVRFVFASPRIVSDVLTASGEENKKKKTSPEAPVETETERDRERERLD